MVAAQRLGEEYTFRIDKAWHHRSGAGLRAGDGAGT